MEEAEVKVMVADESHIKYIDTILTTIAEAAKKRGSGIAKRSPEYVATKMREAKAVIALQGEKFAGFSYIETWGNKHYVTTSGLIVHPDFRGMGLAKRIKNLTFTLARKETRHYPFVLLLGYERRGNWRTAECCTHDGFPAQEIRACENQTVFGGKSR